MLGYHTHTHVTATIFILSDPRKTDKPFLNRKTDLVEFLKHFERPSSLKKRARGACESSSAPPPAPKAATRTKAPPSCQIGVAVSGGADAMIREARRFSDFVASSPAARDAATTRVIVKLDKRNAFNEAIAEPPSPNPYSPVLAARLGPTHTCSSTHM